jgi:restriction system protein
MHFQAGLGAVVQGFAGSLDGARAKKGILLTTSTFSADAREYVERIDKRIALIDGKELARLLYDCGVGLSIVDSYVVRRVDAAYFTED